MSIESGKSGQLIEDVVKVVPFENYIRATAAGDTSVWTPTTGRKIRMKVIFVFNSAAATRDIIIKFGPGGPTRFRANLAANSGFVINLVSVNKEGPLNTDLIINLDGVGTVDVTADGDEIVP